MERRDAGRLLCEILSGGGIPDDRLGALSPADWESLAEWALRFKVGGLFHRELKSRNWTAEHVPASVRDRLRDAYRGTATANTSLFLDAAKVLDALAARRLPVLALKGLSLAKSIYGDIALRPMCDLDLLVKQADLVQAGRILLALGYAQPCEDWENTADAYHHLPPFTNGRGTTIELHWNIVAPDSPVKVELEGLWERACPIRVDTVEARAFSTEDLLLHLCIHACFHLQTGMDLVPLCDVAGLMKTRADRIDWHTVVDRAARWGGQKCVYLMLLLVRELLGEAAPAAIMAEMKPADYRPAYFDEALEQIFFDVSSSGQLIGLRIGGLTRIRNIAGVGGKVTALWKEAFPSREAMARLYPVAASSPRIYLCHVLRLRRMAGWYATVLYRLLLRDPAITKEIRQANRGNAVSAWMFS